MDPVVIFNFTGRDNTDTLRICEEWFPFFLPDRVKGITCTKNVKALYTTNSKKFLRMHLTRNRHWKRRMDMKISIRKHEYFPDLAVQPYKWDML